MAYSRKTAAILAKKTKASLAAHARKKECWNGMTRSILWAHAEKAGLLTRTDAVEASWGNSKGVQIKAGCKRTIDQAWYLIFA